MFLQKFVTLLQCHLITPTSLKGLKLLCAMAPNQMKIRLLICIPGFFLGACSSKAYIIFRGHLSCQMEKYQILIAQLATNYRFKSWHGYDQKFRMFIANNPQAQCDYCNEDIYKVHIREAAGRLFCYNCKGKDHFSSACPNPKRTNNSYSSRSPALRPSFSIPGLGAILRHAGVKGKESGIRSWIWSLMLEVKGKDSFSKKISDFRVKKTSQG